MMSRRALFGLPLAAVPAPASPCEGPSSAVLQAAFDCGYAARSHLTAIVGFSALIEDSNASPGQMRQYASYIGHSASALIRAVDDGMDAIGRS